MREDRQRLQDILEAIELIEKYAAKRWCAVRTLLFHSRLCFFASEYISLGTLFRYNR
jgi:hypothetical protein